MGTFGIILIVVLIVALVAGLGWLGYRYVQFKSTHEAAWRDQVLNTAGVFEEKLQSLRKEVLEAKTRRAQEVEKERVKAYQRYLASISVDALEEHTGIGPVTVARLRESGMTTMQKSPANLQEVPGIGPKKEQVVRDAIRRVLSDAQSRFDAGGCREAQEWAERTRLIDKALAQQSADAEQSSRFCEHALTHLHPYVIIARKVSFFGYLFKRQVAELTPELLDAPVEKIVPPLPPSPVPAPQPAVLPTPPSMPSQRGKVAARQSEKPVIIEARPQPVQLPQVDLFRSELEAAPKVAGPRVAEHPRLGHLRATANFGVAVARADGKIASAEHDTIRKFLQRTFGHEVELLRWIDPLMDTAEAKPTKLDKCLTDMEGLFDPLEQRALYQLADDIVASTGKRTAKKTACLERIAAMWGITPIADSAPPIVPSAKPEEAPPTAPSAKPQEAPTHADLLAVLEIAPEAQISADLIRRQYRLLSEKTDPSKLESHGADFVRFATEKRAKIEKAARSLLEELGEKFEEEKKPEEPKDLRHNPDLDAVFGM